MSLPICFVRPFYGVLLWAVISFINPQSSVFYWGPALAFPWAAAVAVATVSGLLIFGRGWVQRVTSVPVLLTFGLWIWFTITTIVSTETPLFQDHANDAWSGWRLVSKILLMTFVTIATIDSFERLRIYVLTIAGCFGLIVAKALPFIVVTGGVHRLYGPEHSMIADNNDLGLALNMVLPFFYYLARTETRRWMKRLCGFLFVATIFAILCTYSRGALVGLVVVLGLLFFSSKRRMFLVPAVALIFLVILAAAPEAWKDRMDFTRSELIDGSARERLNAWAFSWRLASDYPVTGGGFETFTPQLFQRYAPDVRDVHGPHSVYFGVLAEHGFPGLFLYLLLVLSCMRTSRRLIKAARVHEDERAINYANMFRVSIIAFLTSGLFLGRAYFDLYFSIVASIAVLNHVCRAEWKERCVFEDDQNAGDDRSLDVRLLHKKESEMTLAGNST